MDPCESRDLQCCPQRGGPSLGPERCAEPGKGKGTSKQALALLPLQAEQLRGCQGLCGSEKKDSIHGSCVAPSCWARSQARQHLMDQVKVLLAPCLPQLSPGLLQMSPTKGSQCSEVSPAPLPCLPWAGRSPARGIAVSPGAWRLHCCPGP